MNLPPIGAEPIAATRAPGARGAKPDDLDSTLSSTTPDVPKGPQLLSAPHALGWGAAAGALLGALALRSPGAGRSLASFGAGALKGAAVGAGIGSALLGIDRLTNGEVHTQLDRISLDRRAQVGFVLTHPTKPWLAGLGLGVARDARAAQEQLYGMREPLDGPQDAFRHAYASALFSLRAMREHGAAPDDAHALAVAAGEAHEVDGQDNNDSFSRAMDTFNNAAGTSIVGDGRANSGEQAGADGLVSEHALRDRVIAAMGAGTLQLVERSRATPAPRTSTPADLPSRTAR